jgi:pimeloyl-ACP methyl ester carboxylesterase
MIDTKPTKTGHGPTTIEAQVEAQVKLNHPFRSGNSRPTGKGHVGLTVAGSLLSGLVAAIALIVGPLRGSQEHVITGAALLGFAFGWVMLAVLSTLWTDQPQRWAIVPAAFMALFGAGLIVFAPDARALNVVSWVWPLPLLALVFWMIAVARRELRSHSRRLLLYPVFGVLALAAVGGAYQTVAAAADRATAAKPGQLVDVGGHRLYLHCTGSGSPTVVLESGAGESSAYWGWIAPAVARDTRVCVYDRAGRGFSDPARSPQDGVGIATDLHTLLDRAHVAAPYVLVGHSSGGPYVQIFAARYPDEVAGVVLLDGQPPNVLTKLPGFPAFLNTYRTVSALFPSLARLGAFRLLQMASSGGLPAQARDEERATQSTAELTRSQRDEFAGLQTALQQAQALKTLGNKPLIVLTAAKDAQEGWLPLQDEMAALSTNSIHRVLPNTTHSSLIEDKGDAAMASQAIHDVVESIRAGTPLTKP